LVLHLEAAAIALGIDVVGNRGAFQPYGVFENARHCLMQTRRAFGTESRGDRPRMNTSLEQRLVGINVSHASNEVLIQQKRLDSSGAALQQVQKILP